MKINKHYYLGEALYRLSVYEKGRCPSGKIRWSKKYVAQLTESINIMSEVAASLSDRDITSRDYEIVSKVTEYNKHLYFDEMIMNQLAEDNYSLLAINDLSDYIEVNQLMSDIINQLQEALKTLNKKNKSNIWYLLQALHNLPRVYIEPGQETLFNGSSISCDMAVECAKGYLKMIE